MKFWSVSDATLQSNFIFPSQRETVVKTEGCQKDLVVSIMLKKNLYVKYLICFNWLEMLLPLGKIKQGLVNGDIPENMNYGGAKYLFFLYETYPRTVLCKHADLIIMNLNKSS